MKHSRQLWVELTMELAAFSVLVASVSLLWKNNLLLFIVMLIGCPVALALWHNRLDLSFFLIIAVLGTLAEAVFVQFGVWYYTNPTLLGIPLWFPLAFGTTGDVEADLLAITSVHPMREDAVRTLLAESGGDWNRVERLLEKGALAEVLYRGQKFYVRRFLRPGAPLKDTTEGGTSS